MCSNRIKASDQIILKLLHSEYYNVSKNLSTLILAPCPFCHPLAILLSLTICIFAPTVLSTKDQTPHFLQPKLK